VPTGENPPEMIPGRPDTRLDRRPEGIPSPVNPSQEAPPAKAPAPKPRPTVPPPDQPAPETPAPRPAPPQMTPRLSADQEAELRKKTGRAITEAETNLQRAYGRPLSDAQRDMVEKIQNFIAQAREAREAPDWSRALILAEKARVLSVELANSL
jgi:hypothetical protein